MTTDEALAMLTPAEIRIMRGVVDAGGSTKIAAHNLSLSRHTVRNCRSLVYQRLGVHSAAEAWIALGWLRLPPRLPPKKVR